MQYRNQSDSSILTQGQVRKLNPNISLPKIWSSDTCELLGIDPILATPKPAPSTDLKTVYKDGTEQDGLGNWTIKWAEKDMFSDTTDEDGNTITQEVQEAEYLAKKQADEYAQDVANAEKLVEAHIQAPIDAYNADNGVKFASVHNCASYINPPSYSHYQFCVDVWQFNVDTWEAARNIQLNILDGTIPKPETDEAFIAMLPIFGE